ncbi:MAG: nucleoside-triphosphatase [Myxococcota bacterium]
MIAKLASGILSRDKTSVAAALNLVEDRREVARTQVAELLAAVKAGGRAAEGHRVGVTGPPGVGKSTLAAALARALRSEGLTVGVVAVDPSSVRSGGSLLGDRARMNFDPADAGLFVRSVATAGESGGLSWATHGAVAILGAAYDVVLVETTGVGQSETDVRHVADTVVLVIQPGSGDVLQFLKAGVMEIPDLLVVNKADQGDLAQKAVADLRGALATALSAGAAEEISITKASARTGEGIGPLIAALRSHRNSIEGALPARRRAGEVAWTLQLFVRLHGEHGLRTLGGKTSVEDAAERALGTSAPPQVCRDLSARYLAALTQPTGHTS